MIGRSSEVDVEPHDMNIKALTSLVLDKPPSCLEFSQRWPDYLVIGTYKLRESQELSDKVIEDVPSTHMQKRDGSVILLKLFDEHGYDTSLFRPHVPSTHSKTFICVQR